MNAAASVDAEMTKSSVASCPLHIASENDLHDNSNRDDHESQCGIIRFFRMNDFSH